MAMPSGYTELGIVGYADKGTYSASATYNKPDVVYYNGSSFVALKDGLKGVTPSNNGINWKYLARGFQADTAAQVSATDKRNLIGGGAGKSSTVQALLDKIGDWLLDKVITNDNFVTKLTARLVNNGTTTNTGFALDARYGKTLTDKDASLKASIDTLNRKTPVWGSLKDVTPTNGYVTVPSIKSADYDTFFFCPLYTSKSRSTYMFTVGIEQACTYIYLRNSDGTQFTDVVSGYYMAFRK